MTEHDWLSCPWMRQCLKHLDNTGVPLSLRQANHFRVAAIQHLGQNPKVNGELTQAAVIAERALELKKLSMLERPMSLLDGRILELSHNGSREKTALAVLLVLARQVIYAMRMGYEDVGLWDDVIAWFHTPPVIFLHEVVGNPFRPLTRVKGTKGVWSQHSEFRQVITPEMMAWNSCLIPSLARAIYETQAFSQMPFLGDALEEAGCTSEEILRHCRGFSRCAFCVPSHKIEPSVMPCPVCNNVGWNSNITPCFRGCWVLDLFQEAE